MNAKSAEVAQILLSNGADVNAKNNEGKICYVKIQYMNNLALIILYQESDVHEYIM